MVFKAMIAAFWLAVVGLACVGFELAQLRTAYRIQRLQGELDSARERLREARVRYNRQVSPDMLERDLEEVFVQEPTQPEL